MNDEVLIELLEKLLQVKIDAVVFERPEKESDVSERDRQLLVFSRRLFSLKAIKDPKNKQLILIYKIESFVKKLHKLESDIELYFWKARSKTESWGGWCTENEILYYSESNT